MNIGVLLSFVSHKYKIFLAQTNDYWLLFFSKIQIVTGDILFFVLRTQKSFKRHNLRHINISVNDVFICNMRKSIRFIRWSSLNWLLCVWLFSRNPESWLDTESFQWWAFALVTGTLCCETKWVNHCHAERCFWRSPSKITCPMVCPTLPKLWPILLNSNPIWTNAPNNWLYSPTKWINLSIPMK